MRVRSLQLASATLSTLIAAQCGAATLDVTVGQNSSGQAALAFNPPTLTIHVNDTVRFTNAGGVHNVDTYGASVTAFHCSNDCSGGSNSAPSANAWVATVTFASAGTVTYHCDLHGTITGSGAGATCSGMCGTITVLSSVPVRLQSFDVD
ncbi:MAG TPA: plastocyanin/azurin family copper-binding protein [Rudaea sp.]|nr:plastocyanin/azurin family copper-binding protein [Rudaea sp.]